MKEEYKMSSEQLKQYTNYIKTKYPNGNYRETHDRNDRDIYFIKARSNYLNISYCLLLLIFLVV